MYCMYSDLTRIVTVCSTVDDVPRAHQENSMIVIKIVIHM